jgi:hypothetical protein
MRRPARFALALTLAVSFSACATAFRNPRISDLRSNPGRYENRTVNIDGVVTTSWSVPLAPFHFYKVDDGTGEVTVLSQGRRTPGRGARVHVKGRVDDVAVLGGQSLGLHLREESLNVKR